MSKRVSATLLVLLVYILCVFWVTSDIELTAEIKAAICGIGIFFLIMAYSFPGWDD